MHERGWEGPWVPHLAQTSQDGSKGSLGPFISRYRPWTVIPRCLLWGARGQALGSMSQLWEPPLCLLVLLLQFLSPYVAPEQGECPLWSRSAVLRVGVPSAGERFSLTSAQPSHTPPPISLPFEDLGNPNPHFLSRNWWGLRSRFVGPLPSSPLTPVCPQDLQVSQGHSISWQSGLEAPDSNCLWITTHF